MKVLKELLIVMNKIYNLKKYFFLGKIDKPDYIDQMFIMHKLLKEYARIISDSEIEEIQITANEVLFKINEDTKFLADFNDKRTPPLEVLNFNNYENKYSEILRYASVGKKIIFDIGANIGWYSIVLSSNDDCQIHAFEPVNLTFEILNKNKILNNRLNVKVNNLGVSNFEGEEKIYYEPENGTAASLSNILESNKSKSITCKFTTIDSYIMGQNITCLDIIKCDIEGAEIFAIKGGIESIKKFKPIIFLEMLRKWAKKFNYHPDDIINILDEIGYSCFAINNKGIRLIKCVSEDTKETNFVFCRYN